MTDETQEKTRKVRKQLTAAEWEEAKLRRQRYGETIEEIAKRLDVSGTALNRRFKRHGIVKGSHAELERKAIEARIENVAANNAQEMITKSEMVRELTMNAVNVITRYTIKQLQDTIQSNKPLSSMEKEVRTARMLVETMEKSKDFAVAILRDYEKFDEEKLPVLTVRRLTDDDLYKIREEQLESDELLGEMGVDEEGFDIEGEDESSEIVEVFEDTVTVKS